MSFDSHFFSRSLVQIAELCGDGFGVDDAILMLSNLMQEPNSIQSNSPIPTSSLRNDRDKLQKKRSITSLFKGNGTSRVDEAAISIEDGNEGPQTPGKGGNVRNPNSLNRVDGAHNYDRGQGSDDDGEGEVIPSDTLEVFSQLQEWFQSTGADADLESRDRDSSPHSQIQKLDSETQSDSLSPSAVPAENEVWWQSIRGFMNSEQTEADAAAGVLDDIHSPDDLLSLFVEWISINQKEQKEEEVGGDETAKDKEGKEVRKSGDAEPSSGYYPKTQHTPPPPHGSPAASSESSRASDNFSTFMGSDSMGKETVIPSGVGWARYQAWQESNTDEAKRFRKWLHKRQVERRPSRYGAPHRKYSNSSIDSGHSFQSSMERDSNSSVTSAGNGSYGSSYDSVRRENHSGEAGGSQAGSGSGSRSGSRGTNSSFPVTPSVDETILPAEESEKELDSGFEFFKIDTSSIESLFRIDSSNNPVSKEVREDQKPNSDFLGPEELLDQLGSWVRESMNLASPLLHDGVTRSRSSSGASGGNSPSGAHMGEVWNPIHEHPELEESASSVGLPQLEHHEQDITPEKSAPFNWHIDLGTDKVEEWVSEQSNEFKLRRESVQAEAEEFSNSIQQTFLGFLSPDKKKTEQGTETGSQQTTEADTLFEDDDFAFDEVAITNQNGINQNSAPNKSNFASEFDDDDDNVFLSSSPTTPLRQQQLTPRSQGPFVEGTSIKESPDMPKQSRAQIL